MRIFIVGQKWLAAELLAWCSASGHDVAGVAVPADNDRLALAAHAACLPVMVAPSRLSAEAVPDGVDLILAAHAHCFITAEARSRARLGALGYHPSLLPRHRGRDAVRWTIHMREAVTGGSIYWMDDSVDGGPVAVQDWCHVRPDDTAAKLWRRELAPMGLRLFARAIDLAAVGALARRPQEEALATWEPAIRAGRLSPS